MNPMKTLPRTVSAILLLFACVGTQAQVATGSPQSRAAPVEALAFNDAAFVSQSVPLSMTPGAAYNVSVTMKNTGSVTWPAGGAYLLGAQNPADNTRWGSARVALKAPVAPGGQATFSFQAKAPTASGTYGFQWQMVQEFVAWFGAATPNVAVTVGAPAPRNDAQVVGQTVPSPMTSGKSYTVAVTLKNTGTTTWKSADAYMLGAQNPADNRLWNGARVALGATVAPGQQYTFNFPVTAPAPGSYSMQWKMLRESVEWFGATSSSPVTVAAAPGSDIVTYIHTDALGSPVARSDAAGNIISRTRYEPYGGTASGVTPTIGFTGHMNDADTGLVYMQQRYYDPVAGRFLSIDPVVSDANTGSSFNRYAYASNNPFKYVDPDGRAVESVTMDKNKNVHIVVGMSYKGAVTPKQADAFNKAIVNAYSGMKGEYAVNVTIIPSEQAKLGNYVTVLEGTNQSKTSGVGARETTLYTNDSAGATSEQVMAHEFGHLAGAFDQYGASGTPDPGYENSIMGSAKSGKVDERTINEILERNPPKEPKKE